MGEGFARIDMTVGDAFHEISQAQIDVLGDLVQRQAVPLAQHLDHKSRGLRAALNSELIRDSFIRMQGKASVPERAVEVALSPEQRHGSFFDE